MISILSNLSALNSITYSNWQSGNGKSTVTCGERDRAKIEELTLGEFFSCEIYLWFVEYLTFQENIFMSSLKGKLFFTMLDLFSITETISFNFVF